MSAQDIGNAFVQHYYSTFDANRAALASLYSNSSTLSFDKDTFQGQQAILEKLSKLPQTQHRVDTTVIQPSVSDNAILIVVTGKLVIDNGNPLQYAQTFQLVAHAPGQFYIHNDFFSLIYG
ncbi:nuclear transport factor [Achlya hypogyna]|uniref:Nuclear transport factor 2 n=1 Tax=Achlya hypogyna TaxID=1202772 RepID=A0A1V9YAM2_ACHHY|nr:nuclear transport factor [Achlya hypogyna]